MKSEDKEVDINEVAIALEVDSDVIDKVRSGEVTHIVLQINEQNQNMILESIDGNLVLVIDDMPTTYHGCYLYNGGVFPYAIKSSLSFLILNGGEDDCLTRIISVDTEPGTRFSYQSADKPIVEDPNGDSCIWEVDFEVVPMPAEPRHYLMRWNPSISSFKEKDYKECVENMVHGMFRLDWSIYEWEEARRGDYFYMLRTGDYKAGIVFSGQFITDPYPADDWAGSTKRRMYVDLICMDPIDPRERPRISLEELKKEIPGFDWSKGHSGALLSEDVVKKLDELDDEEDDDFPLAN
jgi:hypothetical protein